MKDVIIIGGGPAGMSAAIYVLRAGKSVLIIEKNAFGGQIANSPKVENFPAIKQISGLDLSNQMFEQILDLGAEFELEDVEKIDKIDGGFLVKTNYHEYECKAVIIANGLKHRHLNLESEERLSGKGVSYCAVCDGAFYKGEDVVLIGDGNTAVQYAILLSNYCKSVTVCTLFDKWFADEILVERMLKKTNVTCRHNLSTVDLKGENELESVLFKDTKTNELVELKAKACFVAIGQIPENEKFANLVELNKGFIVTNELMQTKTPGIYAAGDTRIKDVKQCVTATSDGAIAAMSALKFID